MRRTFFARCATMAVLAISVATSLILAAAPTQVRKPSTQQQSQAQSLELNAEAAQLAAAVKQRIAETYGKLPLTFETNQGQSDKQVKFLSRGEGYTLFLTGDEAVLSLRRAPTRNFDREAVANLKPEEFEATNLNAAVLRMKLVGVNPAARISGVGPQDGKSNYFVGNDPSQWHTDVTSYSQVRYENAYPGVDLVYYGNRQQLEYDFVVAPGTNPSAISLNIAAESAVSGKRNSAPLRIAEDGDLLVPTAGGDVRFHKPVVFQPRVSSEIHSIGGDPSVRGDSVDGRWVLKGGNQVGFEVSSYDASRALVVDPVLSYSTYIGGTGTDGAFGVAIDQYGNAYVTGFTSSTDFPTKNPYQKKNAGGIDTFALKLNRTGTALVYSTYLGGNGTEYPFGMAVDSKGEAYEIGNTGSTNFPVYNAYQSTCLSCALYPAVFLTKFSQAGNTILYSTYLGGSGDNRAFGITLDSADDAYIVGWTTSPDFPVTSNAYQSTNNASVNTVFVSELNPAVSGVNGLVYSTYLGGNNDDVGFGIAVDSSKNIVVTGYTYSLNFPVTSKAFQTTTTTNGAAFVSKLNPSANGTTGLLYSTFLGGTTGTSAGNSVQVDSAGNAYVTGYTCASDFPVMGAVQSKFGGDCTSAGGDAFVTELKSDFSAPVFSTYLGGSGDDVGFSIGLDQSNNIYIIGRSSSTDYPVTPGAFQTTMAGGYDCIYSVLSAGGTRLIYSTYLGGTAVDVAFVMATDKIGDSYIIGRTYSTNFPVTPGVFQSTLKGSTNAIVFEFSPGDQAWPMSLNFGTGAVGQTSAPLSTTFTNSDLVTLTMGTPTLMGTADADYTITNSTCGSTLAPGASCTITMTFTASTTGTRSAILAINDSAANTPQSVALSGVGSSSNATLTPATLTFATQLINTNSASQPATLSNTGTVAISITKIATTGPYSQTNNCPSSLAANSSCTINVVFTPTKAGTLTGTLTVTDNAPNSPQTVTLSGTGTVVSFSPTSINFGNQTLKTSSPPQTIAMTNNGTSSINISKTYITGSRVTSFIIQSSSTCPTGTGSLGAGLSCTIVVVFDPQLKGALNANVTALDTGGGSPQNVPLSGTGD